MLSWKKGLPLPTVVSLSLSIFLVSNLISSLFPASSLMSVFTLISSLNRSDRLWNSLFLLLNGWQELRAWSLKLTSHVDLKRPSLNCSFGICRTGLTTQRALSQDNLLPNGDYGNLIAFTREKFHQRDTSLSDKEDGPLYLRQIMFVRRESLPYNLPRRLGWSRRIAVLFL